MGVGENAGLKINSEVIPATLKTNLNPECREAINKLMIVGEVFEDLLDETEVINGNEASWRIELPYLVQLKPGGGGAKAGGEKPGIKQYLVGTDLTRWNEEINQRWTYKPYGSINQAVAEFVKRAAEQRIEERYFHLCSVDAKKDEAFTPPPPAI